MNDMIQEVVREFVSANISPPSFASDQGVSDFALRDKVMPSIMAMFLLKFQARKGKSAKFEKAVRTSDNAFRLW